MFGSPIAVGLALSLRTMGTQFPPLPQVCPSVQMNEPQSISFFATHRFPSREHVVPHRHEKLLPGPQSTFASGMHELPLAHLYPALQRQVPQSTASCGIHAPLLAHFSPALQKRPFSHLTPLCATSRC